MVCKTIKCKAFWIQFHKLVKELIKLNNYIKVENTIPLSDDYFL